MAWQARVSAGLSLIAFFEATGVQVFWGATERGLALIWCELQSADYTYVLDTGVEQEKCFNQT